ncbi:hypothetical protein [Streptomyces sp. NPDC059092]|uniref:hypothetical protein n=1 Tax=Streptomyces sp. NPDC059092 TaxID=3346725 RepID=UPI0036C6596B
MKIRALAVSLTAAAVLAAVGLSLHAAMDTDVQVEDGGGLRISEDLQAADLSRDEYVAAASQHVFHGTVIRKTGEQHTGGNGDLEQQWLVEVDRAFKGDARGTITVNTTATDQDGDIIPDPGAPAVEPGKSYVFAGMWGEDPDRYETYGGAAGVHASNGLTQPDPETGPRADRAKHHTVEQRWSWAVEHARPGPDTDAATEDDNQSG